MRQPKLALPLAAAAFALAAACAPKPPAAAGAQPVAAPEASLLAAPAARSLELVFLQGEVRIGGAPAELGSTVALDSLVETGPGSRCDLVFEGRNVLSVGQNSIVRLGLAELAPRVGLDKGGLTSVLKKLDKLGAKDSFVVESRNAVAGVRGTSFCVWADAASTYVCACNGEVRTLDARGGNELLLESAHHVARIYAASGEGFAVAEAALLHHSDESVQSAADRIGYVVDWTKVDR